MPDQSTRDILLSAIRRSQQQREALRKWREAQPPKTKPRKRVFHKRFGSIDDLLGGH